MGDWYTILIVGAVVGAGADLLLSLLGFTIYRMLKFFDGGD